MMATRPTVMLAERESAIEALRGCTRGPSAPLRLDFCRTVDAGSSRILVIALRALRETSMAPRVEGRGDRNLWSRDHQKTSQNTKNCIATNKHGNPHVRLS
jgi:hypothetical protein